MKKLVSKFKDLLPNLGRDTHGSMVVWGAMTMPVVLGGALLSVDVSRVYNLDNELQSASDALARAGAAELDSRGDSLTRASRAVNNLVENNQKFGDQGFGEVTVSSVRFLKSVPVNDYDPITADHVTNSPYNARYIEVNVTPTSINTVFPVSVVSKISSTSMDSSSVAGMESGVCGVAPVFVCNPYEDSETTLYEALEDRSVRRKQIQFKRPGGNSSQYGPGNFGYLDVFGGHGQCNTSRLRDAIAIDVAPTCINQSSGVYLRTGNINSVRHAVNTRFDMYSGPFKNKKNDPAYAPAENVVKGYAGNKVCKLTENNSAMGLPRDTCFDDGSCTELGGRMGNGDWDFARYVRINHNYASSLHIAGTTYFFNHNNNTVTPSDIPTRYEMYRWEIDTNCVPGSITYGQANTPEEGLPQCHSGGPSQTDVDRRVLNVAVLNCGFIQENYGFNGASSGALPVDSFVKVFITQPMGKGQNNILYGEMIGQVVQGQDSVARDSVVLRR